MSRPIERWVATDNEPLGAVLDRLGPTAADACREGRVFVDGRRAVSKDQPLSPGASVEVYAARARVTGVAVLAELSGLLFVDKPAGIATEPDRSGTGMCVLSEIATLLSVSVSSLHALSRLDLGVSGVVLVARDAEARRRVGALREQGALRRRYVALAAGAPEPVFGAWRESIGKLGGGPRRGARAGEDGSSAETGYRVVSVVTRAAPRTETFAVLALEPITGRTHQLRVHAAAHGAPLLGDRTYGGAARITLSNGEVRALGRVFLHAAWVELPGAPRVASRLPQELRTLWTSLGGDPEALDGAADCVMDSASAP